MTWIIDVPEGLINAAGICYGTLDSEDSVPASCDNLTQKIIDDPVTSVMPDE